MNTDLNIQLLGGFSVAMGGETLLAAQWKLRRAQNLVKLLALTPNHRLHKEQVIELLWPGADFDAATNNLHQTMYIARRTLETIGAASLFLENGFLSLIPGDGGALTTDVEQFEAAAGRAKKGQSPEHYQAAVDLYTGELLPDDRYEEWTMQPREKLRQGFLDLLLELARLYELQGEYTRAIDTLQRLVAADRTFEEAHAGLMRMYAISGQRQQALRQYQILQEALQVEIDTGPSESTIQLYETIQSGRLATRGVATVPEETSPPDVPPPNHKLHNLPFRVSTFIGREKEIDEVLAMLRETRLLTVTGAGGVGKTSLAVQVGFYLSSAIRAGAAFPDGIWLVELSSLDNPLLIPETCVQQLGLSLMAGQNAQNTLLAYLERKQLLLLLDNCEHLLNACARFCDTLLKHCRSLTILTTSREPLGLIGETTYRLPSLAVADVDHLTALDQLAQVESVRLFVERAKKVVPGFALTATNAPAVAQIGRRLDGIPLAIELAAARVRMMAVNQIVAFLDDTFSIVTGGSQAALLRQQTLKATIDWSYALLTGKERIMFQRLSVFWGGWTLEAAEAVCADADGQREGSGEQIGKAEVLNLLGKLVDKSLIEAETREKETRYRLLETMRQYAHERLKEAGAVIEAVRNRHLEYYAHLTGEAEQHLRGKGQVEWLDRLEQELDNLRAAMGWSRVGKIEKGLQITADLMWFWNIRSMFREGVEWIKSLLETEQQRRVETALTGEIALQRARALRAHAFELGYLIGWDDAEQVRVLKMHESVALLRSATDTGSRELGISLFYLLLYETSLDRPSPVREGMLFFSNTLDQPSPAREEMLAIFQQQQERFYFSEYYATLSGAFFFRNEIDQAAEYIEASLAISREIEDIDGIASRMASLGFQAMMAGKYKEAETFYHSAIELCQQVKNRWFETEIKALLLWLAVAQGNNAEVIQLGEVALATFRELNYSAGIYHNLFNLLRSGWSEGDFSQVKKLSGEITERYAGNVECQQDVYFYSGRAALSSDDLAQAAALLKKSVGLGRKFSMTEKVYLPLGYVPLFMKQGKGELAARLLGSVDWIYRRTSGSLSPRERSEHDESLAAARSSLGEAAFERAWKEGQAMTLDQAIQYLQEEMARQ